jgi:hypothetical protein
MVFHEAAGYASQYTIRKHDASVNRMFHFWCPVPVSVRTKPEVYRENMPVLRETLCSSAKLFALPPATFQGCMHPSLIESCRWNLGSIHSEHQTTSTCLSCGGQSQVEFKKSNETKMGKIFCLKSDLRFRARPLIHPSLPSALVSIRQGDILTCQIVCEFCVSTLTRCPCAKCLHPPLQIACWCPCVRMHRPGSGIIIM